MTTNELLLFKEMIKECVRDVIKEEKMNITEQVKKAVSKDLMDIKKLVAKQINESRKISTITDTEYITKKNKNIDEIKEGLSQLYGGIGSKKISAPIPDSISIKSTNSILAETAMNMTAEDISALKNLDL